MHDLKLLQVDENVRNNNNVAEKRFIALLI